MFTALLFFCEIAKGRKERKKARKKEKKKERKKERKTNLYSP